LNEARYPVVEMKVAMLSAEFPPKWGGVGIGAYYHALILTKEHKVDYDIFTRKLAEPFPKMPGKTKIHSVPFTKLPMYFATSFGRNAVKRMEELGKKWDLCHVEGNMTLLDKDLYPRIKAPIITSQHGTWRGERSEMRFEDVSFNLKGMNDLAVMYLSPRFDKYEDYALMCSDVVVAISKREEKALKGRGVKDIKARIVRIAQGVDEKTFKPSNKDPKLRKRLGVKEGEGLILFVGRLAGRKGLDMVVEAFDTISKEDRKVRLAIVGTGPRTGMVRKEAKSRGFEDRMTMCGTVDLKELARYYATADVTLFPSRWEGFGLIPLESMASGTPCVSTRVGAADDIITDGVDGYLVDVDDHEALAEKAMKVLKSPDKRETMGRAARKKVEDNFTWSHTGRAYYKLYQELAG
jgi:glycosyltransferase involved in cell wall biosynthesis